VPRNPNDGYRKTERQREIEKYKKEEERETFFTAVRVSDVLGKKWACWVILKLACCAGGG